MTLGQEEPPVTQASPLPLAKRRGSVHSEAFSLSICRPIYSHSVEHWPHVTAACTLTCVCVHAHARACECVGMCERMRVRGNRGATCGDGGSSTMHRGTRAVPSTSAAALRRLPAARGGPHGAQLATWRLHVRTAVSPCTDTHALLLARIRVLRIAVSPCTCIPALLLALALTPTHI